MPTAAQADWAAIGRPGSRAGARVEFHRSIPSTNDRASQLLRRGESGTAVVADLQTAGRGRLGRTWSSPPGLNLMVSVGVRLPLAAPDAWLLSAAVALALLAGCRAVLPVGAKTRLGLRWPNDIVDQAGRKVAGILVETAIEGDVVTDAVAGTGVNVNWRPSQMPPGLATTATSLAEIAGQEIDRKRLLSEYLAALDRELEGIAAGASPVARYRDASWLDGRRVEIRTADRRLTGLVSGVADDGGLVLQTGDGVERIGVGEVVRVVGVTEASPGPAASPEGGP